MTIDEKMIIKIEENYRCSFTPEFIKYLLERYGEEPLPYTYSEQDLYEQIRKDIRQYDKGLLKLV